ncbi:MAG: TolC family protein [Spirochaetaceae bacterium]|nr:TolC family protein [Spirochaetaceae bacterium]
MKKTTYFIILFFLFTSKFYSQIVISSEEEAVAIAIQNSDELKYLRLQTLETMNGAKWSFQDFLPSINFSFSEADNVKKGSSDSRSKNFSVSIAQPVFNGGVSVAAYKEGKLNSLYEWQQYLLQQRKFSESITNAYYQVLLQQDTVKINKNLVESAALQLALLERQTELGYTLETDYLEYLISFRKIQHQCKQAENELRNLEYEFKKIAGLDMQTEIEIVDSNSELTTDKKNFMALEYIETIFPLMKDASISLKQQNLKITSSQNQLKIQKSWFLPTIMLEGSASFSGSQYPLTEPEYSLRVKIGFRQNPFFQSDFSAAYGFSKGNFNSANNTLTGSFVADTTYFSRIKTSEISIIQQQLSFVKSQDELYISLRNLLESHDNYIFELDFLLETLEILQKKLDFAEIELANGKIKHIQYLDLISEIASLEIEILQKKAEIKAAKSSIEINCGIPFGGLENVCKKN